MGKILLIAFIFFVLQGLLTYLQINNYKKAIKRLRKKGHLGVGTKKGKISAGSIVILVSDNEGNIIDGEEMRGFTVFSRFKKMENVLGRNIEDLKKEYKEENKSNQGIITAINSLEMAMGRYNEKIKEENSLSK